MVMTLPFILLAVAALLLLVFGSASFWLPFILALVPWFYFEFTAGRVHKTLARSLRPWVIALVVEGVLLVAATYWLDRADWGWIFWIEEDVAPAAKSVLDTVLPRALGAKLLIIAAVCSINIAVPRLRPSTRRFKALVSAGAAVSVVVTVLAGLTVFGGASLKELGRAVSAEKQQRTEVEALAVAELMLGFRLAEQAAEEADVVENWLDSILLGVRVDMSLPPDDVFIAMQAARLQSTGRIDDAETSYKNWKKHLIEERVEELRTALAERPLVRGAGVAMEARITAWLGRGLSARDRIEAKRAFEDALKRFASEGARFTGHPLTEFLKEAGLPELLPQLVADLYKAEVERFAKMITDPLADALFRPNTQAAARSANRLSEIAREPVFEAAALPREIAVPTKAERIEARRTESMRATRAARR